MSMERHSILRGWDAFPGEPVIDGSQATIGSLFSGIGGLELGLESLGLGPVIWQCDNNPHARAVLAAHWPSVHCFNDVREINEACPPP